MNVSRGRVTALFRWFRPGHSATVPATGHAISMRGTTRKAHRPSRSPSCTKPSWHEPNGERTRHRQARPTSTCAEACAWLGHARGLTCLSASAACAPQPIALAGTRAPVRGQEALMGPEGRLSANYQKIAVGGVFDLTRICPKMALTAPAPSAAILGPLSGSGQIPVLRWSTAHKLHA